MEPFLKQLLHKAGKMALEQFRQPRRDVKTKAVQDVVTKTDFAIDQLFHREINKRFPDDLVYSEEGDAVDLLNKRVWVVDPIDGTGNFLLGIPLFAISVGIAERGLVTMAFVYDPFSKELFSAVKGQGVWLNKEKIHVSDTPRLAQTLVVRTSSHGEQPHHDSEKMRDRLYHRTLKVVEMGASSLALAYVAAGRVDACFITGEVPEWDTAAGSLLVQEAGGLLTHLDGAPWRLGRGDVLATNTRVHQEFLKSI